MALGDTMTEWKVVSATGPTDGLVTVGVKSPQGNTYVASTINGRHWRIDDPDDTGLNGKMRQAIRQAISMWMHSQLPQQFPPSL